KVVEFRFATGVHESRICLGIRYCLKITGGICLRGRTWRHLSRGAIRCGTVLQQHATQDRLGHVRKEWLRNKNVPTKFRVNVRLINRKGSAKQCELVVNNHCEFIRLSGIK